MHDTDLVQLMHDTDYDIQLAVCNRTGSRQHRDNQSAHRHTSRSFSLNQNKTWAILNYQLLSGKVLTRGTATAGERDHKGHGWTRSSRAKYRTIGKVVAEPSVQQ